MEENKNTASAENTEKDIKTEAASTEETKAVNPEKESRKDKKEAKKRDVELLKDENDKLKKELAAEKDAHLRMLAEYDNFRKRSLREKETAYGDSKANTLSLILPVIDNFDRAAENKTDDLEVYKKGIEMTLAQFSDILKKLEVESFGEVGEGFDPSIHNAVMHVQNEELPENTIAAVFEKGYKMGERILRCATVQVAN